MEPLKTDSDFFGQGSAGEKGPEGKAGADGARVSHFNLLVRAQINLLPKVILFFF